jgi:hypothetical protein
VRQINPRHHNVLEAEIKPGQHQSQILHHGTGLLLEGVRQFAGRIGLSGDKKNRRQPLYCNCALPPDV